MYGHGNTDEVQQYSYTWMLWSHDSFAKCDISLQYQIFHNKAYIRYRNIRLFIKNKSSIPNNNISIFSLTQEVNDKCIYAAH